MPIVYSTPKVAISNDFKQKGPTCWYYAAKILVKLHDIRKLEKYESQWRALHQLRKIISELSSESDMPDNSNYDLFWLKTRHTESKKQIDDLIYSIEFTLDLPRGWYSEHLFKIRNTILKRTLNMDFQKAKTSSLEVGQSLELLKKLENTKRFEIFNTYIPNIFKSYRIHQSLITKNYVERVLRENGPFYVSGNVWSKKENRSKVSVLSDIIPDDTRILVKKLEDDSAHAVIVQGISGYNIFYKDPNNSSEVRIINFDIFKRGWIYNDYVYFIVIDCPEKSVTFDDKGGCKHTAKLIKLNKV